MTWQHCQSEKLVSTTKFERKNSLDQPNKNGTYVYFHTEEMDLGTQFKLTITYNNGINALFKPKR